MKTKLLPFLLFLVGLVPTSVSAQSQPPTLYEMQLDEELRKTTMNWCGSCVQWSICTTGFHVNDMNAALLPWDSVYGPQERGGATPNRVASYCNRRGIEAWSVTGRGVTKQWARFAVNTGRYAALGFDAAHFQTVYGYDFKTKEWLICDNRCPEKITRYSEAEFDRLHALSGEWIVVLKKPSCPAPEFIDW